MKRLIYSLLFILAGVVVADYIVGEIMWQINQHSHDTSAPKIKYMAYEANEDFIAMGTSRCNSHYVASILEDSLGINCYNGGIDASDNIYSHYLLLQLLLRHHSPKYICLEVMWSDCYKQPNPFKRTSYFAPYIGQEEKADSIFRLAGTYYLYRYCHTYRYNARAVANIVGTIFSPHADFDHGYLPGPQPPRFPESLEKVKTSPKSCVDSLKLKYMQKFIDDCRGIGTKVIFCISPSYRETDEGYYEPLKALARDNNIPVLDYDSEGLYTDHPEYFKDAGHLWDKGARIWSQRLGHDLKEVIKSLESQTPDE